jgi:hypothetical protein
MKRNLLAAIGVGLMAASVLGLAGCDSLSGKSEPPPISTGLPEGKKPGDPGMPPASGAPAKTTEAPGDKKGAAPAGDKKGAAPAADKANAPAADKGNAPAADKGNAPAADKGNAPAAGDAGNKPAAK